MKTDIVLAGVGGQGILTIATVIGRAALQQNLYLKQAEVHGMSQRGGDVQSNLRISDNPIASDLIPLGSADLILSLEPMEALRYTPYISRKGWMITNTVPFINTNNYPDEKELLDELKSFDNLVAFDMDQIAKEAGSPKSANMVLLGAASPFLTLSEETLLDSIKQIFANKKESIIEMNCNAFMAGRNVTLNYLNSK